MTHSPSIDLPGWMSEQWKPGLTGISAHTPPVDRSTRSTPHPGLGPLSGSTGHHPGRHPPIRRRNRTNCGMRAVQTRRRRR